MFRNELTNNLTRLARARATLEHRKNILIRRNLDFGESCIIKTFADSQSACLRPRVYQHAHSQHWNSSTSDRMVRVKHR